VRKEDGEEEGEGGEGVGGEERVSLRHIFFLTGTHCRKYLTAPFGVYCSIFLPGRPIKGTVACDLSLQFFYSKEFTWSSDSFLIPFTNRR
jgi:hypothetical protein